MSVLKAVKCATSLPILSLKTAHLSSLVAPMDGFHLHTIIEPATHWEICDGETQIGYFCIEEAQLLNFYVTDTHVHLAGPFFAEILRQHSIKRASVATLDSHFLALCMDHQTRVAVESYLFFDHHPVELKYPNAVFRQATLEDLYTLEKIYAQPDALEFETTYEQRLEYIDSMIALEQLFGIFQGKEALGIGECRVSVLQPPYADLGMIVAADQRRKGIGAFILAELKAICYEQGLKPICGCAAINRASKKTIEKAGFVTTHRILEITF